MPRDERNLDMRRVLGVAAGGSGAVLVLLGLGVLGILGGAGREACLHAGASFLVLAGLNTESAARLRRAVVDVFYRESQIQVFISYAETDEAIATDLRKRLADRGVRCFLARKDLRGGDAWRSEIRQALRSSREVWVVASPSSMSRFWVGMEVGVGWVLDKRIVPVRVGVSRDDLVDGLREWQSPGLDEIDAHIAECWPNRVVSEAQVPDLLPERA